MTGESLKAYTDKIRSINRDKTKVFIKRSHIEVDNIHREISVSDVERVLVSGKVERVREEDQTLFVVGLDPSGRKLVLQCSILDSNGEDTLVVSDAVSLRVGTAYEDNVDDKELIKKFLEENEDYEMKPGNKGVQRKIKVVKI